MNLFRSFSLACGLLLLAGPAFSQRQTVTIQLHNLPYGHIAPAYEIALSDMFSFRLTAGITPSRGIPGSQIARNLLLEDPENSNFGTTGTYFKLAFTPELRAYFSRSGAPEGFYLSGWGRYAYHRIRVPYSFTFDQTPIETESGLRLQIFGIGAGIGYQALFANDRIALDVYAGAGGAFAPLRLDVIDPSLSEAAYEVLFNALAEELKVNLSSDDLPNFITNRGLVIRAPLTLPMVRAGIGLGFALGT